MGRIEVAEPDSPIVVFKDSDMYVNSVFYTSTTQQIMVDDKSNLIGVFDNTMDLNKVAKTIKESMAKKAYNNTTTELNK